MGFRFGTLQTCVVPVREVVYFITFEHCCRQQSLKRVLSNKKLLLVLDLDHTLLNSTRFDEVRTALYLSCHKVIGKLPCWSSF